MKYLNRLIFLASFMLISLGSCKEKSLSEQGLIKNMLPCNANDAVIREVTNEKGTIGYSTELKKYFISVVPEGHIDTVIYGFLCSVPEELKKPGLKIIFNGSYSISTYKPTATFPGHEYYNLNLKAYKL
jgi:hypothetical protein